MAYSTYQFWALQRYSRRSGWWTLTGTVRDTRRAAIGEYKNIWAERGDLHWRRERDAGKIRCVKVSLAAPEGHD